MNSLLSILADNLVHKNRCKHCKSRLRYERTENENLQFNCPGYDENSNISLIQTLKSDSQTLVNFATMALTNLI